MNPRITQEALAERLAGVRWHGHYFSARCPFHNDNEPSLLVYDDGAYCMGICQRQFSLSQLWARTNGRSSYDFPNQFSPRVIRWEGLPPLPDWALRAHQLVLDNRGFGNYWKTRGLENRIEPQRLGWWSGWATIPIFQKREVIGIILRTTDDLQKELNIRYMVPPGQPPMLYIPDEHILDRATTIFLTFGAMDALALRELGFPSLSFDRGQRSSTEAAALLVNWRCRIAVIPDQGEEQTACDLCAHLGWRGEVVLLDYPQSCKDPADFLKVGKSVSLQKQLGRYTWRR